MTANIRPLAELKTPQRDAAKPDDLVWLSASAGTGKTQVLTARVLRLLLRLAPDGRPLVQPENILCLTFTKAGAAEMAERIQQRLAYWVQAPRSKLWSDLTAIGAATDDLTLDHARTLFARVIDAPGGGIRIQTIHSFCQSLLASFPLEAGLLPGFRPLEEREQASLRYDALTRMLEDAEGAGREDIIDAVAGLALRGGEEQATAFLNRCPARLADLQRLPDDIALWLRGELGLPDGTPEQWLRDAAGLIDEHALKAIAAAFRNWGAKTGLQAADVVAAWLAADEDGRLAELRDLRRVFLTDKDELRAVFVKQLADVEPEARAVAGTLDDLLATAAHMTISDELAAALTAGRAYAQVYEAMKRARGVLDFDDLIGRARDLLIDGTMSAWIRFKLDQNIDHLLVDEAQDTNLAQWAIIAALSSEYFAGEGSKAGLPRTLFTVGDYKQAIFGFQGTSPIAFKHARERFSVRAEESGRSFARIALDHNFRSTPPILAFVDAVFALLGPENMGPVEPPVRHRSAREGQAGEIVLWDPVVFDGNGSSSDAERDSDGSEEGWIERPERELADRIARQVRAWIDGGIDGAPVRAGEVMILVRKRGDLARLLVARLQRQDVPVAGIDRLRLSAPLAVQDLMGAIRFALQPDDDLNLASLLVSPLIGWSQDQLMIAAMPRRTGSLWRRLREMAEADGSVDLTPLRTILAMADRTTPYRFLEEILSGPLGGRARLLYRLGNEARDTIEELLNAALLFEQGNSASLQLFVRWFDRGDVEIKRDAMTAPDEVRVLTVHGAKGLQAPIVVLADATGDPDRSPASGVTFNAGGLELPLPQMARSRAFGAIASAMDDQKDLERQEHWRLLYVALTRAEERLFIGGALGSSARGEAPVNSWYALASKTMSERQGEWQCDAAEDAIWGGARRYRDGTTIRIAKPKRAIPKAEATSQPELPQFDMPRWLFSAAPEEARPPRPLAPSSLGEDDVAGSPFSGNPRARERGRLLHALFERLPQVPAAERKAVGTSWLAMQARDWSEPDRNALLNAAITIIDDPAYGALFAPDALAEAPIAAVLDTGLVVSGQVDRLAITPDVIHLVDFKTGNRVPDGAEEVPIAYRRQMGAYVAALGRIFPDRAIEAGLLYTAGPKFIPLPPDMLVLPGAPT